MPLVVQCIRIKGSHNYQNITEVIVDITKTYKIHLSRITHNFTDNIGKAFGVFSSFSLHEEASTSDMEIFDENNSESSNFELSEILNLTAQTWIQKKLV